jgi:PAS domain S-box-containing protein
MQALLDLLPDAAILVDREGRIVHVNAQSEALFGYAPTELLNQPVEVLMPERFRQQHVGERQRYVLQPTKRVMGQRSRELWGRRKDGSEFPVDIAIGPFEEAGDGSLVLALVRDMTMRREMERTLQEQQERLRAIVETSRDAIVAADQQGRVTYWNPAAEAMFGYSTEEMRGQPLTRIMPERFKAAHTAGMSRFLTTGEPRVIGQTVELAGLRKDGTEFPLELSLANWKRDGEAMFAAIIRDSTERKRKEETIRKQADDARKQLEIMYGREERVLDLKHEINALLKELGRPPQYGT